MEAKLEPKLALCAGRTTYFHPWVDKVAQVVPNGAQSGSKGAKRVPTWRPKCSQGCTNGSQNYDNGNIFRRTLLCVYTKNKNKTCFKRNPSPSGGPSSKIYPPPRFSAAGVTCGSFWPCWPPAPPPASQPPASQPLLLVI